MKTFRSFVFVGAIASALALSATRAHATLLDFTWSDVAGNTASWTQDSNPTVISYVLGGETVVSVTSGIDSESETFTSVDFYSASTGGGFVTANYQTGTYGAQDYTGSEAAPVFSVGTYATNTEYPNGPAGTLTVTAVSVAAPEPVSLALLASGLVGLGAARRRLSTRG